MDIETARFTGSLAKAQRFSAALDDSGYTPLPAGWLIAVTDVVRSRDAIAAGRYKAVNMAGVSMISAAMNELGTQSVPYAFGGDGAALAIAPEDADRMRDILARTIVMAQEELELELRAALVPVERIRADGFDVRVKAVRVSDAITNYAFAGGGTSHAERLMKAGEFRVASGAPGSRPDLAGLSCRWTPVSSEGKRIVSLILEAGSASTGEQFAATARRLLALTGQDGEGGSPLPEQGPNVAWPVSGLELEARATRGGKSLAAMRRELQFQTLLAFLLFKTGWKFFGFDPKRYKRVTGLNTDFRKVQDGLRMTVSLTDAEIGRTKAFLEELRARKLVRYGLFVQDQAVLTCFVPSVMEDNHFHFLDGAGGGYAAAASAMAE